ncbi:hypothetical protein [Arthrobacter sp. TMS1-12-1]
MSTPQDTPNGHNDGGQYGYRPAGPSNYAYPTSGVPGPAEKGAAPQEVHRAYYLILAAGVVYLLSSIVTTLVTDLPDVPGATVGAGIGLVVALIIASLYVVLAVFIRRGRNWARITATVLAALNVLAVLATLLLMPVLTAAAASAGQPVVETSALSTGSSVLVMLLGVAGVVLTYLKPARPYFAPQKLGY